MYPFEFNLELAGFILAGTAAVSALYLIPLAGKSRAWLLLSAALVLLALERGLQRLSNVGILLEPMTYERINDVLDVVMAGCLLGSVYYIRDIFLERNQAEEKIRKLNEELEIKVQERTRQLLAAQEELVRKEKLALLGQVADTVGHELRNPLGVMNNAVYFLQAVLSDADETIKEYLGIIKDEIADAERIVSDLLDAVRIKPPRPEVVDIAEVIGQTLRKCDIPPSVTVSLDVPATLSAVRADPMHLHQIFWNLITNGLEAMPQGGTLAIRVEEDQTVHSLHISIRDSGIGMTPEQQAKLFQPMFTTKARRIGLGLVVVKNLTQINGGSVAMKSYPGAGSTFTVTLPGRS